MTKRELRKVYRQKRAAISAAQKDKYEDLMLIRFQQSGFSIPLRVMTYSPMEKENEYDPLLITKYCSFIQPGLQLALPVMDPVSLNLNAIAINGHSIFKENDYGIVEPGNGFEIKPEEIDLVIVPLLTFDERGHRIGYGKGYYDRFLGKCRKDTLKIGFSFFEAEVAFEEVNDFDVKLDICISPFKTYQF